MLLLRARKGEPEQPQGETAVPMKKTAEKRGNNRNKVYDMSGGEPFVSHMDKARFAMQRDELPEGTKESYFKNITSSLAGGGKRKCICGESIADTRPFQ